MSQLLRHLEDLQLLAEQDVELLVGVVAVQGRFGHPGTEDGTVRVEGFSEGRGVHDTPVEPVQERDPPTHVALFEVIDTVLAVDDAVEATVWTGRSLAGMKIDRRDWGDLRLGDLEGVSRVDGIGLVGLIGGDALQDGDVVCIVFDLIHFGVGM